ncbi:MAG: arginine--tRNA ligase [Simkaniaceae bacterium]|nr:arginine--tRNA ligase [Candidatus Sacchlamyda saccharinae]
MQTIAKQLEEAVEDAFKSAFGDTIEGHAPEITPATQPEFGHYQCNNALKLAKALRKKPRDIAQEIVEHLKSPMIQKLEIAGPGFINITLNEDFLAEEIQKLLQDEHYGAVKAKDRKKVIVEFSSPNIAKELHVGHLRSTIIGDALARLFEFLDYDVLRLNHIGDWGTQFGMLIAYLKNFQPDFFAGKKTADLSELMSWYKESKKLFDADPEFKKQSQLEVVRLQGGDGASLEAWEMICDISRKAFKEIYSLLDIKLEERGESFYNPYLAEVVDDLEEKGLLSLSNGAKCVFLDGFKTREGTPLPMIVQKSDGGYNYDTTDMAAMRHRIEKEGAERIIVITDAGQSLHFQMIEKTAEKAGYLDSNKVQFDHVPFGVVLGPDGKKFKTRSGETEKLIDLITQAVARATAIFKERLPEASDQEIQELGTILGVDAIKYADLSSHRLKDYVFSYDRMLRFEGNTAAFLLYAYVRIQGIKRKVGKDPAALVGNVPIKLQEPSEIDLALHLRRFGETLESMARELLPNRLCEYLYELAEKFNAFFRDCRVEGSDQEESRLLLCEATARILAKGLDILGLKTLPKM